MVAIAAGGMGGMALAHDGTVWTWGNNSFGQLGDNTLFARSLAAPVSGLQDVVSIALGSGRLPRHASGACAGGHQRRRGNGLGQQPRTASSATSRRSSIKLPVTVPGLTGVQVKAVFAGGQHSLALTSDARILAWGA